MQRHSSSDRSVGYLLVSIAQSVGHTAPAEHFSDSLWKGDSRKFAVASEPSSAPPSTIQRHGGIPSASKRGDQVAFVASSCIRGLRLVTAQLPKKSWPIGSGQSGACTICAG